MALPTVNWIQSFGGGGWRGVGITVITPRKTHNATYDIEKGNHFSFLKMRTAKAFQDLSVWVGEGEIALLGPPFLAEPFFLSSPVLSAPTFCFLLQLTLLEKTSTVLKSTHSDLIWRGHDIDTDAKALRRSSKNQTPNHCPFTAIGKTDKGVFVKIAPSPTPTQQFPFPATPPFKNPLVDHN